MTSFRVVQPGEVYTYQPVGMDYLAGVALDHIGKEVRVVNKYGCPPANTMGHCFIETLDGKFLGLVVTNSLTDR